VCSHQHAVGPGAAVGVGGARGVPAFAGEIDLARRFDCQRQSAVGVRHHLDLAVEHRQLGVVVELTYVQARRLAAEQALAGKDAQWRVAGDAVQHDLAFEQSDQPLLAIKMYIYGTAGIELQLAAVGQLHLAALAHRAAVVGGQGRQNMLLAQAPGGCRASAEDQQQLQRLPPAGRRRRIQRGVSQGRGHAAQALVNALDMVPGALVLAVGIQPVLPGGLLAWVERALLHFHQPAHGLFGDLGRDVHRAK